MNCNKSCFQCKNFYKTTSVTASTSLVLNIQNVPTPLTNNQRFCICIAQAIPATSSILPVAVNVGSATYSVIVNNANNLYSDQIKTRNVYCLEFATDTKCFTVKSCNLCKTKFVFPTVNPSTPSGSNDNTEEPSFEVM